MTQIETKVQNIIDVFDRVFEKLGQKRLLENSEFIPDKELNAEHFLRFRSVDRPGRIDMMFEISKNGLSFWLDRANEIPEWSTEYLQKNQHEVEIEISRLFQNPIQVDRKGNKTTIVISNKEGQEIRKYKYYQGLGLNWFSKKETVEFRPFFDN